MPESMWFIQEQIDDAARMIVERAPNTWAGWVTYLCEAIEANAKDRSAADQMLCQVEQDLARRIADGGW